MFADEKHNPCPAPAFAAYFDDSGSTNIAVVAGFVAPILQWTKFKAEWNKVLEDPSYRLPAGTIFHMREFAHSVGPFKVFSNHKADPQKAWERKQFIERLIGFTKVRASSSFSCSIRLDDYECANQEYKLRECFGGPFSFLGRTCAGRVRDWARRMGIDPLSVEFTFEDGTEGKGDLRTSMTRDGFLAPSFCLKSREAPGLQAADLIAWEFHKHMKQAFENNLKDFRRSFDSLLQMPGDNGVFPNIEALLRLCAKLGVPERRTP